VIGILDKKEIVINIIVYNRSRVYCNNNMLYIGIMDETNIERHID
jgi:hypothetical protein